MKKLVLKLLRLYFSTLSVLWPSKAGKAAFQLFQKTRKLPFKKAERDFYASARKLDIVHPHENIRAYEVGNQNGKLVVLVHGWESNAGSMGGIAKELASNGFRVVTFDLPAHGKSSLVRTNLHECREAFRALIYQLNPTKPFSIVSHSFGSAVSSFALADSQYKVDNFIMLTSPNKLIHIFEEFSSMIGLNDNAFERLLQHTDVILKEPIREVSVATKVSQMQCAKLLLVHDANDKVLPYSNSLEICSALADSKLHTIKNAGHYRMLWNREVITTILSELTSKKEIEEREMAMSN